METVVDLVEQEARHYEGVIEKQAAQIYRLSAVVDDLLEMLLKNDVLTEVQMSKYF